MKERRRLHYGWLVLIMGTLGVFGALGLARFGYSTLLPAMQADLGINNEQAGLLATFNLAGYLALSMLGGVLAARYGARLVVTLGLAVAGAGMILTGPAADFLSLGLWRGITGLGSGAANMGIMGLWAAWFAAERRGLASGIAVSGSSLALILTGLLVPPVLTGRGAGAWRDCWVVFGAVTLLLAAASLFILRNRPSDLRLKAVGEQKASRAHPGPAEEKRRWREVFFSPPVWGLGLVYTAYGFSYIIYMTFFIKRLVAGGGYSPEAAGGLFTIMGWFSLGCGLLWGAVSDRLGRKGTLCILYLIQAAAFGLFALRYAPGFFLSAVLFGLTAWSIPALMAAVCGDLLGPVLAPAALGFITLFFGAGQVAGPVVAGAMADTTGSFVSVFLLAAAAALLGAAGSVFLTGTAGRPVKAGPFRPGPHTRQ